MEALGSVTPDMVNLAKAIALNLDGYTEPQRKAIMKHALFCASVAEYQKNREEAGYARWFEAA